MARAVLPWSVVVAVLAVLYAVFNVALPAAMPKGGRAAWDRREETCFDTHTCQNCSELTSAWRKRLRRVVQRLTPANSVLGVLEIHGWGR